MKYRKKPKVIEAVQWTGENQLEIHEFAGFNCHWRDGLYIETREGQLKAAVNDYIIKGIQGEFYPCKPEIFAETYEPVPDEEAMQDAEDRKRTA